MFNIIDVLFIQNMYKKINAVHIQSQCALWLISLINSLKGRDKRQMLEIWQGHRMERGSPVCRVSQTFRCYETPPCLDRTEPVCALKERRAKNSLRKLQKFNVAFELKKNRLCTPLRECWEKHTKHNTMWLAFFEGTGQQTHAIVPESHSRFRGRAYRVHSRAAGRPAPSQAGGDVGEAVLTAHRVPACSGTVTDCVAGR